MIRIEVPSCISVCMSCGRKWKKSFIRIHIAGGAGSYSKYTVLCEECANKLKEML